MMGGVVSHQAGMDAALIKPQNRPSRRRREEENCFMAKVD